MRAKKRGFTYYTGIEVLIGVMVALMLLKYAYDKGTGLDFERMYLAKDITLTINALHGVPGDAFVDYENKYMQQFKQKYDIKVKGSTVSVSDSKDPTLQSSYLFGISPHRRVFWHISN